jgi:hypothetical protein
MTDDQAHGQLSAHGNPIVQTPALDRLHRKGRANRFESFFSNDTKLLPFTFPNAETIEKMQNDIGF